MENVLQISANATGSPGVYYKGNTVGTTSVGIESGHKYFISLEVKSKSAIQSSTNNEAYFPYYSEDRFTSDDNNTIKVKEFILNEYIKRSIIITAKASQSNLNEISGFRINGQTTQAYGFALRNFLVCDLTRMFGAGNEPKDAKSFEKILESFNYDYSAEYEWVTLKSIEPLFLEAGLIEEGGNQIVSTKRVNIPSQTYFEDGMKSVELPGIKIYDEIIFSSQKAIARVGSVDLGSLKWMWNTGQDKAYAMTTDPILNIKAPSSGETPVINCAKYATGSFDEVITNPQTPLSNTIACDENGRICFFNSILIENHSAAEIQAFFSDVILCYELDIGDENNKKKLKYLLKDLNWEYEPDGEHFLFVASLFPYSVNELSFAGVYTYDTYDNVWNNVKDKTISYKTSYLETTVYLRNNSVFNVEDLKAILTDNDVALYSNERDINPKIQALPMPKGNNKILCYNDLLGKGPFLLEYYSHPTDGSFVNESGLLTSYRRKHYVGRTVNWNQLINKTSFPTDGTVVNGLTVTNNGDGTFSIDGTASANTSFSCGIVSAKAGDKYLICGCSKDDTSGSAQNDNYYFGVASASAKQERVKGIDSKDPFRGVIFEQADNGELSFNCWVKNGYVADRLVFRPQVFDLTQMFGAGNEPATPAKFWSYFPNKVYPYNAGETRPLFKISRKSQWGGTS